MAEWIDPDTGVPAEDHVPRLEDHLNKSGSEPYFRKLRGAVNRALTPIYFVATSTRRSLSAPGSTGLVRW
jgi:hypothetical protein